MSRRAVGDRLVMSPMVAGEAFERHLQANHVTILLMGLGMSSGLGAFAVAGLGTAFPCTALLLLDTLSTQKARAMSVEMLASGRPFPATHVEDLSIQLMEEGAGVKSVAWDHQKRERA